MITNRIRQFLKTETASSAVLGVMVVLAMVAANSPISGWYEGLHSPAMTMLVNDGLMSIFFLVIGIELKRELVEGELSSLGQALLPLVAALGGVMLPALIYFSINQGTEGLRGWAIPMATDIAFTLGLLGMFGSRLPSSLRIFLMALAVIDDLFAILVIALFYSHGTSYQALGMVAGITGLLLFYSRRVKLLTPYLLAGAALWIAMHESGIHATLAAVILGMVMPLFLGKRLIHPLHGVVAFGVVPVFVFVNAGVPLAGLSLEALSHPVSLGVVLGLFFGKQLGIFAACALMIKLGFAKLPQAVSWVQLYAAAMAAGIGFTMSLFIGALAFENSPLMLEARAGVICGSLASAAGAVMVFMWSMRKKRKE